MPCSHFLCSHTSGGDDHTSALFSWSRYPSLSHHSIPFACQVWLSYPHRSSSYFLPALSLPVKSLPYVLSHPVAENVFALLTEVDSFSPRCWSARMVPVSQNPKPCHRCQLYNQLWTCATTALLLTSFPPTVSLEVTTQAQCPWLLPTALCSHFWPCSVLILIRSLFLYERDLHSAEDTSQSVGPALTLMPQYPRSGFPADRRQL